jgi:hypothetical protein
MTNEELLQEIELQRALMVVVSTGGHTAPRIDDVNGQYVSRRTTIARELVRRGLQDPNPFADLWAWYGKWSGGDLPHYQSRRRFIADLYQPLRDQLTLGDSSASRVFAEPTGWDRVDRDLDDLRLTLEQARTEPEFQSIGLRCREILISLAQVVFDPNRHATSNDVEPSATDAKRRLEAYIATELAGSSHESLRRHAKAALELSNDLQHRRTAAFRTAALCAEATTSVVNLIAIIAGRRDL